MMEMRDKRFFRTLAVVGDGVRPVAAAAALALVLATAGAAVAQQGSVQQLSDNAELVTTKATIQAVNLEKRQVTLKTADGRIHVLKVGSQVANLAQVKPGDVVKAAFYQSIATDIRPPGEGAPGITSVDLAARAKPGTLPAGAVVESVVYTFEIVGIEPENKDLVVKDPNGNIQVIQVLDPKNQALLPTLKLGDKYDIVITEGLAVAVEPAK
jgi:hypothetical protein